MPLRIVAFDHLPHHLLLYQLVLQQNGYEVCAYAHDPINLREMQALQPDLILWGNVTGLFKYELDLLERIRKHPYTQHVPLLILTTALEGMLNPYNLHSFAKISVLAKPFAAQQLLVAVKDTIGYFHHGSPAPH